VKLCGVLLAALVAAAPILSSPVLSSPALAAGLPPSAAALTIFRVDVSRYPSVGVVVTVPGATGAIPGGDFAIATGNRFVTPNVRRLSPHDVELILAPDTALAPAALRAEQAAATGFLAGLPAGERTATVDPATPGNWTGPYPVVAAKLTAAYREVAARHLRTALTLYDNTGCGDGPAEMSPLGFSRRYVPAAVRAGIGYVFLSYYEDACGNRRPSARTWTAYFRSLHALYPRARLGFGEIGLADPVTPRSMRAAESLIRYYYGLRIRLPYYTGGYFWWYYAEDCLPYATRPLWRALSAGFRAEKAAQR